MIDERDDAAHRTLHANVTHEGARVDVRDHRNAMLGQVLIKRVGRAPAAGHRRKAFDDECFEKGFARLDVFEVDSGIADERVRHRDDLPGVGRVRQDLLITRHRGIENDFTHGLTFKAVSVAAKNSPVFEQQRRLFQSRDPILSIGQYLKTAFP